MAGEKQRRARSAVLKGRVWPDKGLDRAPVGLAVAALLLLAACFALQYYLLPQPEDKTLSASPQAGALAINEVMSANRSAVADDTGAFSDWVELVNRSGADLDVSGWTLTDGEDRLVGFTFPQQVLSPGEMVVIYCSGDIKNVKGYAYHAPFRLSAQGETLILRDAQGAEVDRLELPVLGGNQVYARQQSGQWALSSDPTPGLENTEQAHLAWAQAQGSVSGALRISEAMSANRTYVPDENGDCWDYIELYNGGDTAIDLSGYGLSDEEDAPGKYRFPQGSSIAPGQYLLLYASGKTQAGHLPFRLSAGGEEVILSDDQDRLVDQVTLPALDGDRAYQRVDGVFTADYPPTPGFSNDQAGLNQVEAQLRAGNASGLILNEAVASARAQNANKSFPDWVELYNGGSAAIDLSGYGLSDDPAQPRKWQFPQGASIQPGGYVVVLLNGQDKYNLSTGKYAANFKVSYTRGETLTLSDPSGKLIDRLPMIAQVSAVSYGRLPGQDGYYYMDTMTQGAANSNVGYTGRAGEIAFSQAGGWYDQPVTVSLSAPQGVTIRYTLDASEPDENSPVYQEPIQVSQTTIIRAKGYQEDKLPSLTYTASYLYGQRHTLPVISLVTDPDYLYDEKIGIYSMGEKELKYPYRGANFFKEWERAGNVEYFDVNGNTVLSQGAGVALQGQYSRMKEQKAFKLTARNAYGENRFNAQLFPNRDYDSYRSFILRASGQDSEYTRMRDAVLTSLAENTSVMYQDALPVIVYVNGEYFGHYNLRERIHKYSIAQWEGWEDVDAIDIVKGNDTVKQGTNKDYAEFLTWLKKNGCKTQENLDKVAQMVDIDNYLEYVALEMYIGNTDLLNVKRYRNTQEGDGRWKWVLYDTDWAFYTDTDSFRRWLDPEGAGSGKKTDNTLFVQLMKNTQMQEKFLSLMGELMYTSWRSDLVLAKIDAWYDALLPEMPAQFERWGSSLKRWNSRVKEFRGYAQTRPKKMLTYIKKELNWTNDQMRVYFGDIMDELGL